MFPYHPHPLLRPPALVAIGLALGLAGCGNSELPVTRPVSGTVTFDGGPCPGPGSIRFAPLEVAEGLPRRPGRADFDTDGRYVARSFGTDDGLVPGTYRVLVSCWKEEPMGLDPGVSYIPADFEAPELIVGQESGATTFDIEVPRAR